MENINPLFILQPIIVIAIATALMIYWYKKRSFHKGVWLYSLIAYAFAIALKSIIQLLTGSLIIDVFGEKSIGLGLYYGLQTMILEVGLAFVIAYFAITKGKLDTRDAEAYGSGLAFWENVGLLSILSLINLIAYYIILPMGDAIAELTYNQLITYAPELFSSNLDALGLVGLGVLERISSTLIHVAWGYLCFMAVIYRNKRLFLIALPMGLIDFLVPFASYSLLLFELIFLALSLLSVLIAWYATKRVRKKVDYIMNNPS